MNATPQLFPSLVANELDRTRVKNKSPLTCAHHGYAVLLEEVDELWDEVRKNRSIRSNDRMLEELVQIGAMAQRMAEDVILSRES